MATPTKKQPKTLIDASGLPIPIKIIPKSDLLANKIAIQISKEWDDVQLLLRNKKTKWLLMCDDWYVQLLEQYKLKEKDTSKLKGGYTFYSYDKSIKIELRIGERIEFDANLKIAKELADKYLEIKTKDVDGEISILLNNAFTTTRNNIDSKKVLQLMSYNIKHPVWLEMVEAIKTSITRHFSKRYMALSIKDTEGKYVYKTIQFSSL
ncbi:MAG TPA: DUF3164 family protein [Chitinophagales bacterium]|nr:DUF3164 family protein [Chitinophagales bacterium]